jgi:alkanesulfonate monooxygenase SsuD/methylene tetrahydromethanopterin reductase-like flavin-dependent oxidoreductase (luciferase family)
MTSGLTLNSPAPSLAIQGGSVEFAVEAAVAAERNGFHSAWTCEIYNRSAPVTLTAMALGTSRIGLGSAVAWGFGRSPLTLATDARSIDLVSGGRLFLGIGTGGSPDWHGEKEAHPAPRVEELVDLLRQIWHTHEKPLDHNGRFYSVWTPPDPTVPPPVNGTIPVLVGGMKQPMARAAGAVADGFVGHPLTTPAYVNEVIRPALAEGVKRAGRTGEVPIAGMLITAVDDENPDKAREAAALTIAVYVSRGGVDFFLDFHGFQQEGKAIMEASSHRDLDGMKAAVSDRMLDEIAVFGTAAEARQRYAERFEGLYERPLLYSPTSRLPVEYLHENVHAVIEAFAHQG